MKLPEANYTLRIIISKNLFFFQKNDVMTVFDVILTPRCQYISNKASIHKEWE